VEGNSRAPNESRLEQESTNDETHDSYRIDGSKKNNREKGEKKRKKRSCGARSGEGDLRR
jgi:hypothetical protein